VNQKVNIGVLLWPSIRSIAYLNIFNDLGIAPSEIYWMNNGPIRNLNEVIWESEKYNYAEGFFDASFDIDAFIEDNIISVDKLDTSDVNSVVVQETVKAANVDYILFTGGGILNSETLGLGKQFIHIHPGTLPGFRGSTCFYYSILAEGSLGASAIFMDPNIDVGGVIESVDFNINYPIEADQPLFVDYVLDSFIRAQTLRKVLLSYKANKVLDAQEQPKYEMPAYYVMHPLLRHKSINKMRSMVNYEQPLGINQLS